MRGHIDVSDPIWDVVWGWWSGCRCTEIHCDTCSVFFLPTYHVHVSSGASHGSCPTRFSAHDFAQRSDSIIEIRPGPCDRVLSVFGWSDRRLAQGTKLRYPLGRSVTDTQLHQQRLYNWRWGSPCRVRSDFGLTRTCLDSSKIVLVWSHMLLPYVYIPDLSACVSRHEMSGHWS